MSGFVFVFCFKQKTAYEMRISDWSSDVCSSDLWRSTRGRTITFASIFHLKPTPRGKTPAERRKSMALPYVKGMDDAELADWKTFDDVRAMRSSIFEDHALLIDRALERLDLRYVIPYFSDFSA